MAETMFTGIGDTIVLSTGFLMGLLVCEFRGVQNIGECLNAVSKFGGL